MISRVRMMLDAGMSVETAYEELVAQGVDSSLAHWAVRGAQVEIDYWHKHEATGNEND